MGAFPGFGRSAGPGAEAVPKPSSDPSLHRRELQRFGVLQACLQPRLESSILNAEQLRRSLLPHELCG